MKAGQKPACMRFSAQVISLEEFRRSRITQPPPAPAAEVARAEGAPGLCFRWLALAGAWWTWWW